MKRIKRRNKNTITKNGHVVGEAVDNNEKMSFYNPTTGWVSIGEMVGEISKFIDAVPTSFYSLVIGTDSQAKKLNGKAEIDFVTAVVVHRKGKGAKYFWRKDRKYKTPILREKIYTETLMSLDIAQKLVPQIRKRISPTKYDLEIHIDVGPIGPTRDMIREVVGMVNGNGFTAKTKPHSWGASTVADKHTS